MVRPISEYGFEFQLTATRQHSEGRLPFPTDRDSKLLGLCTGALAAAAVSSSHDLTELISAAVHATVIALHTGLRSAEEVMSMDGNNSLSQFSMFVRGISGNEAISLVERFNSRGVSTPITFHSINLT